MNLEFIDLNIGEVLILLKILPAGITKDYRYYFYNGAKDIFNGFIHESYNLNENINLLAELQLAYHKYRLYNEKYLENDFQLTDLFH